MCDLVSFDHNCVESIPYLPQYWPGITQVEQITKEQDLGPFHETTIGREYIWIYRTVPGVESFLQ